MDGRRIDIRRLAITVVVWLGTGLTAIPVSQAQHSEYAPSATYRSLTPVDRPVSVGDDVGVQFLGDFVLHPGLAVQFGFDSNVFYEEDAEGVETSPILMVMPTVRVDTPDPRSIRIMFNTQLLWRYYPSDNTAIQSQSGIHLLGDLAFQINPRGLMSFTVYDVVRRNENPPSGPSNSSVNRFYNEAGLTFALHPGGADRTSRMGFTGQASVGYGIDLWDEDLQLDRSLILTNAQVKYYFLPKTAFTVRADWDFISYDQQTRVLNFYSDPFDLQEDFEETLTNVDSSPLRLSGGVAGLLTRWLSFSVSGGYAFSNYDSEPSYEGWVAAGRLGFFFTSDVHFTAGWERGFTDSSFGNYREHDRFSGSLNIDLGNWLVGAGGGYEIQRYAPIEVPFAEIQSQIVQLYSTGERVDPVITGEAFISWNYLEWARLALYYNFAANMTDFVVFTGVPSGPGRPSSASSQYIKHSFFLTAEIEY